jgi:hypothetical protein
MSLPRSSSVHPGSTGAKGPPLARQKHAWIKDSPPQQTASDDAAGSLLGPQRSAFQHSIAGAVERSSVQYYSMMLTPDGAVELAIQPFLTDAKRPSIIIVLLQTLFRRAGCHVRISVSDGLTPAQSPLWVFSIMPEP